MSAMLGALALALPVFLSPEQIARSFAAQLGTELGSARVDALSGGAHAVRLTQMAQGLPVVGGEMVIRVEADGRVSYRASSLRTVGAFDPHPTLSMNEAAKLAVKHAPFPVVVGAADAGRGRLAVLVEGGVTRLVYELDLPPLFPTDLSRLTVDANTGAILAATPLWRAGGSGTSGGNFKAARVFATGTDAQMARDVSSDAMSVSFTTLVSLNVDATGPLASASPAVLGVNCCAYGKCDTSGATPLPRMKGTFGPANVSTVICDEQQVANSTNNATADFVYAPPSEPKASTPVPDKDIDQQPFAEVNVYHHVQQMIAWYQGLDPNFHLSKAANPLRATANFLFPDITKYHLDNRTFEVTVDALGRLDNSFFLAASTFEKIVPGLTVDPSTVPSWTQFDSVILLEGTTVNFGYDASLIDHEFTHAVVHAYPDLMGQVLDSQGAIDSPGAMNEAFADYFSAAKRNNSQIGDYVGHHLQADGINEGALRDVAGAQKCPNDVDGEVHDDSQFFSGALWAGRTHIPADDAARAKFDADVFDGLKLLTQTASFEEAAAAIETSVAADFGANGRYNMHGIFADRGVVGCTRVTTLPMKRLFLAGMLETPALTPYAPGPVQFKVTVPAATATTTFSATVSGQLPSSPLSPLSPKLKILFKVGQPIVFSQSGGSVSAGDATEVNSTGRATLTTATACSEATYYVAIANATPGSDPTGPGPALVLQNVAATFTPDAAQVAKCNPTPDGGTADGGSETDGGSGGDAPKPGSKKSCGCSGGADPSLLALGVLLFFRRRSR